MKKFLSYLIPVVIVVLLVSGCASTSKASADKSDAAKEFIIPEGKGVVYLYRTARMVNAAASTRITINGIEAGGTGPGTFFRWELDPGSYAFAAYTTESSTIAELSVEAGKQYFLRQDERIGVTSGRVTIKEVDEKTGMSAVKNLKLLVTSYRN